MRKLAVFVLILATMFLFGTSNANAGIAPLLEFDYCGCDAVCVGGVPSALFIADVVYEPFISVLPPPLLVDLVEVTYDGMVVQLSPESEPPLIFPGQTFQFFSDPPVYGLPPGALEMTCSGHYSYEPDGVDGVTLLNNGGEIQPVTVTCDVPSCTTEVSVDIKPQSCPNPLNSKAKGVLPVAILGTSDFDVFDIDLSTVTLSRGDGVGGEVYPLDGPPGPEPYYYDVGTPFNGTFTVDCYDCTEEGPDGYTDLTLKFDIQLLLDAIDGDLQDGDCLALQVTGELLDGTPFAGGDYIVMRVK